MATLQESIDDAKALWQEKEIIMPPTSNEELEFARGLGLPKDFIEFYAQVNGMSGQNDIGLYIYPIAEIKNETIRVKEILENSDENVFCIGDSLVGLWYYLLRVHNLQENDYTIETFSTKFEYIIITKSLSQFICFVNSDDDVLYP